jgi:TolB-like protein
MAKPIPEHNHYRHHPARIILKASSYYGRRLIISMVLLTSGCSKQYSDLPAYLPFGVGNYQNQSVGRFKTLYLADQIDEFYRGIDPGPIGITSFVNLDDLNATSSFGRLIGEQVMSELSIKGFEVVELRQATALRFLEPDGEFSLSRDVESLKREQKLGGIVVGTYSASPERVYLNIRLIDPASSSVLSAASAEIAKTSEIKRMLRGGSMPGTLDRVPVRKLALQQELSPPKNTVELIDPIGGPRISPKLPRVTEK